MIRYIKDTIGRFVLVLSIIIFSIIFLTGCSNVEEQVASESDYWIYYVDNNDTEVVPEPYTPKGTSAEELIKEYIGELQKAPISMKYKTTIPDSIMIKDFLLTEEGQLTINFDGNYKALSGITEILHRAAIVKTLTQVEGVTYIEFYVNSQPLMNSNEKPIGFMTKDTFIDNTGGRVKHNQEVTMTLYFANKKGNGLVDTRITKVYDGTVSMEQMIVEQLIKGPSVIQGATEGMLYPSVPEKTKLIKVSTKDGVCYVNLTAEFLEKIPDITDEVAIYSVVNSLVEVPNITKVKFMIDGEELEKYRENIKFDIYFERNLDLVVIKE